ncbi:MAG: UDP-N-acetylmuramate--L-alanine ligase [Bdellovibrionales bacterium]|nr:UDP-N-acetylmuramate--L-alanine ligase [Bdellovibrionales bacterium]
MPLLERTRRVHFIGIGGIGMSSIAELMLGMGQEVTGSDQAESEVVQRLRQLGARVQIGHSAAVLENNPTDVVVYSTAVRADNPELVYAREHGISIIRRAEMLAELMRLKRGIAIAGSHGKTTTTGLVALILRKAGFDPTVAIGGKFDAIGSNAVLGKGTWMVAEADESDGSFLRLSSEIAVVTNVDREHLDHYGNFESATKAFEDFLDRLPFYGRAILCSDSDHLRAFESRLNKPRYWYGFDSAHSPDFLVRPVSEGSAPEFEIVDQRQGQEKVWLRVTLAVPGRHNMLNATAAALVAAELGISGADILAALGEFKGVRRRFERRGEWRGHPIIEDYAHHPTEIRATLQAALSSFAPLKPVVVFQPHRFTRTRDLWNDFAVCFAGSSHLFSLPIYAASEPRDAWVEAFDREKFAGHIERVPSQYCGTHAEVVMALEKIKSANAFADGAPLLILGAGDVHKVIPLLLKG